jgi:hypothetical protein
MKAMFSFSSMIMIIICLSMSSCDKNAFNSTDDLKEVANGTLKNNQVPFAMYINSDSVYNTFVGPSQNNFIKWERQGLLPNFEKLIKLDPSYFREVEFFEIDSISLLLVLADKEVVLSDILVSGDSLFFKANEINESHRLSFFGYDSSGELASILTEFGKGGTADERAWPLIFGAACLIVSLVDAYCDQQIANGVAACTGNCQGAIVTSCGATCVDVCY